MGIPQPFSSLTINYTYIGTSDNDTLAMKPLPFLPGTQVTYTTDFYGNGGNDRLSFFFSDYAGATATINASYHGGSGIDTMELDFTGTDGVSSAKLGANVVYAFSGGASGGTFTADAGVERFVIKGSDFADQFTGSAGNDWLDGRGGLDTFAGSAGDDSYVFDTVGEKVTGELVGGGLDVIYSSVSVNLNDDSNVENLKLSGSDNLSATGSALANKLEGNVGNNLIAGGLGNDVLWGKGGADTFSFAAFGAANKDIIWDFSADDRISLDSSVFTGLHAVDGSLDSGDFVRGAAATVVGHATVIYNPITGIVSYDADGKGGNAAQDIAFVGKALAFFDAAHVQYDGGLIIS